MSLDLNYEKSLIILLIFLWEGVYIDGQEFWEHTFYAPGLLKSKDEPCLQSFSKTYDLRLQSTRKSWILEE